MSKSEGMFALASAVLGVAACMSPTEAATNLSNDAASCEIRSLTDGGGVRLMAVAIARESTIGTYEFVLNKADEAGTSSVAQAGDFVLGPGQEGILGEIDLGLQRDSTYAASLTLRWNGGDAACSRTGPRES